MKLITKEIAAKLYAADQEFLAHQTRSDDDQPIIVKLFAPWAAATWYIVTGTPLDTVNGEPCKPDKAQDWHLFGFCNLGDDQCAELGYVLLSQLEELRGFAGLKVERDLYFNGHTLADVKP
jgi:hypothetical protein